MAESIESPMHGMPGVPRTIDEARALARERFKERLTNGEPVGNCDCHTDTPEAKLVGDGPVSRVAGVRFLDSGQTYFFESQRFELALGDWVVVETARGREACRVVLAPHQIRASQLEGELKPIIRKLEQRDIEKMNRLKRDAADAVKTFGRKIREHHLPMKPISAEYSFDGSHLTLNFSAPDRVDFRELAKDLASVFRCRIELRQVGARDEARLLGGVGRCGRTLCCASWLPMFPDISMGMAKTQDLPLNPQKVSGVCGRLLCCLSYENEQYKQMKAIMPRLGQPVNTPSGPGMVISMQILRESITVRLEEDGREEIFPADILGFGTPRVAEAPLTVHAPRATVIPVDTFAETPVESSVEAEDEDAGDDSSTGEKSSKSRSRRRRRSRGGRGGQHANS